MASSSFFIEPDTGKKQLWLDFNKNYSSGTEKHVLCSEIFQQGCLSHSYRVAKLWQLNGRELNTHTVPFQFEISPRGI
jgi:hypothetical protein